MASGWEANVVCVERREKNSVRDHFNMPGDWLPRLVIWPEYGGRVKELMEEWPDDWAFDESWINIMFETLSAFLDQYSLSFIGYKKPHLMWWHKLFSRRTDHTWVRTEDYPLDRDLLKWGELGPSGPFCVFLAYPTGNLAPAELCCALPDRRTLLPHGVAIMRLGLEEAVLDIAFSEHEESFLEILSDRCEANRHSMVRTEKHFISGWVRSNQERWGYGPEWDRFE